MVANATSSSTHRPPEVLAAHATGWGLLSASSLLIGAAIGIVRLPGAKLRAILMAFGGGALLEALSIELFGHLLQQRAAHPAVVWVAIAAAVFGGAFYAGVGRCLNSHGAFARKMATMKVTLHELRAAARERRGSGELSGSSLPRTESRGRLVRPGSWPFLPPAFLGGPGPPAVMHPVVAPAAEAAAAATPTTATPSSEKGDERVVTPTPAAMSVVESYERGAGLRPSESDADLANVAIELAGRARAESNEAASVPLTPVARSSTPRRGRPENGAQSVADSAAIEEGGAAAMREALHEIPPGAPGAIIKDLRHGRGKTAAIMIWLGILIDAVPESFVIGILSNGGDASSMLNFVLGVFLANFPEAMSSSGVMKRCGLRSRTIVLMWTAIVAWTALGAALGALLFPPGSEGKEVLRASIEGVCGGAMLTMIAETVLPEAFEQGGSVVGLSCLFGFLAALSLAASFPGCYDC